MGRVSRSCALHSWGGNHPLPKEAAPTPLEITLARKTCALHTSTCEGLLFAGGSASISFPTFFGFGHLISGTESTSGSMLGWALESEHPVPGNWAALTRLHSVLQAGDRDGVTTSSAVAALWHRDGCSAVGWQLHSLPHRDVHHEYSVLS